MKAVHKLDHAVVSGIVPEGISGCYRLWDLKRGKFCVGYIGRSDSDLHRRLHQHVDAGVFSFFDFEVTDDIYEAFILECREWHLLCSLIDAHLANINHPAAPQGKSYACPYCFRVNKVRQYFYNVTRGN